MVKFSTALVKSLCFDLNFTLHGFTIYELVLNRGCALFTITKHHKRNIGREKQRLTHWQKRMALLCWQKRIGHFNALGLR